MYNFIELNFKVYGLTIQNSIGKENNIEGLFGNYTSTSLSAGGVRKYDYEIGRFTSVDPLWEKYAGWSPYQYCGNNPVNLVDFSGLNWFITESGSTKWFDQQGDFSDIETQETWTDMGEDFLKFNNSFFNDFKKYNIPLHLVVIYP
ncbi:MAG TPA: RHS repeat-associated core domain-containing protein [Candidatus Kapabacteria bacterium]|nr:RHS repeat-associated core domain-containing protein [Candidatus Kapabacteria bacterium]